MGMRRVVTGHDKNGKSIVVLDGPPARSIGEDVGGLFELWNTDGNIINTQDNIDRADDEIILSPPSNGSKFRYFQINPTPEGIPMDIMQDIAADAFECWQDFARLRYANSPKLTVYAADLAHY